MSITFAGGIAILEGWRDNRTPIFFRCITSELWVSNVGYVGKVDPQAMHLVWDVNCEFALSLEGATLEFVGAGEQTEASKALFSLVPSDLASYSCLSIELLSDTRCIVFEVILPTSREEPITNVN